MNAADLVELWLRERGYGLHDYWCISGRLRWVRPPKGPGLYLWFKEDNISLVVSQNMDVYTDMNSKTYSIGDPDLFEYLGRYFPHDTRHNKACAPDQGLDRSASDSQ